MSEMDSDSMPSRVAARPPTSLSGFSLSLRKSDDPLLSQVFIGFDLACKECGGKLFRFFSFPKIAPDPSPYFGIAPGETIFQPPHGGACVRCGRRAQIFDARTDGYDGRLNGGCAYESGTGEHEARPDAYKLTVWVGYNAPASELDEFASQYGVCAEDLFDAINIEGRPADRDELVFEEVYECA